MAKTKQVSLKLISGNKRKQARAKSELSLPVQIAINEKITTKGLIIELDFAKIVLSIPHSETWKEIPEVSSLLISDHLGPKIDGIWRLTGRRNEKHGTILTFEHSESKQLNIFKDLISPELTFLHSRFKIYELVKTTEDRSDYATHLTELKDYPIQLDCTIKMRKLRVCCHFDFSSNLKEITHLTFKIDDLSKIKNIKADEEVSIDYVFLGVRYLIKCKAIGVDEDFGLLNVRLPSCLFSSTARRFDRFPCNFSARMENVWLGEIVDVSGCGFTIKFHERDSWPDNDVTIFVKELDLTFRARPLRRYQDCLTLVFAEDIGSRRAGMKLVTKSVGHDIVVRSPENYPAFTDLNERIIDADTPSDADKSNDWVELSRKIWKIQDERFPGNAVGVQVGGKMIASFGALPFSPTTVYAHSLRMIRSSASARAMLNIMVYSHIWAELIPNNLFYAGSFTSSAKFTVRMHTYFLNQPNPIRQKIINMLKIFPGKNLSQPKKLYSIRSVVNVESVLEGADERLKFLCKELKSPSPLIQDIHKVECHMICDENDHELALIFDQETPKYFTAIDIFRYLWVVPLAPVENLSDILLILRRNLKFKDKVMSVDVSLYERNPVLDYGDRVVPYFWTFTGKEELGPLVGSLSRLTYSVLRKYGDEGLNDIEKAFAGK